MSTERSCETCRHGLQTFRKEAPWYRQCSHPESMRRHGWKLMPASHIAAGSGYPCGIERKLWERR